MNAHSPQLGSPSVKRVKHAWTDAQILEALDLQRAGHSALQISKALGRRWKRKFTRNQIIGLTNRVRIQADKVPCECIKPQNKDGGMPASWWKTHNEQGG